MSKDLLQAEFVLNADEKISAMYTLRGEPVYCSECRSSVDISFLRKHHDTPVHKAVCLICFLKNYTDETQEDINRMVSIAESQGWYKDLVCCGTCGGELTEHAGGLFCNSRNCSLNSYDC